MNGDDDRDERPRPSWREIDQRRDRARSRGSEERRPRGRAEQARSRSATRAYLGKLDEKLFAKGQGGSRGDELARAVQDALGTPELAAACRAYLEEIGPPGDATLLGAFLDAGDRELVAAALGVLREATPGGPVQVTPGLRAQLRGLADGFDDEIAESAEELLAGL